VHGNLENALLVLNLRIAEHVSLEILIAFGARPLTMDWEDAETLDSLDALILDHALAMFMEVAVNARTMLDANGAETLLTVLSLDRTALLEDAMERNQFITTPQLALALPIEIVLIANLPMDAVGAKTRLV